MARSPGRKLGPFEIVVPIRKGGIGEVHHGQDTVREIRGARRRALRDEQGGTSAVVPRHGSELS